jgi:hypothetical protein
VKTFSAEAALANSLHHHALSQPGSSITELSSQLVGLHNTSPVSPYLSLLARMTDFTRADLDTLMWESWSLVRIRAMRLTVFVFPHDLLEITTAATRHITAPLAARWLRDSGLSQREFHRLTDRVDRALAAGRLTVRALRHKLDIPQHIDLPGIVGRMCDVGRIAGGAPPRSWRSSIREYHRWDDVLPDVDLHRWEEEPAIAQLVHRYIQSYGPVTINDISWWTGITKGRCRTALSALGTKVQEVSVDGWPGPLYWDPSHETSPESGGGIAALPLLDPYVQGYRDRGRFLDAERTSFVYDGGGNATATLVRRGHIIGVWQPVAKPSEAIRYHLFAGGPPSDRRAAEARLSAAGSLYFDTPVDVVEISTMKPLNADGGRSASHPLDSQIHRASRHGPP